MLDDVLRFNRGMRLMISLPPEPPPDGEKRLREAIARHDADGDGRADLADVMKERHEP